MITKFALLLVLTFIPPEGGIEVEMKTIAVGVTKAQCEELAKVLQEKPAQLTIDRNTVRMNGLCVPLHELAEPFPRQ